jgi:hypothetical protein
MTIDLQRLDEGSAHQNKTYTRHLIAGVLPYTVQAPPYSLRRD